MYLSKPGFDDAADASAWVNVSYNYADYYYDAAEGDQRFFGSLPTDKTYDKPRNLGLRGIYGKTGKESIPMLQDLIGRITEKYYRDNKWVITPRKKIRYFDEQGNVFDLEDILSGRRYSIREECIVEVSEGPSFDVSEPTAANAIKALNNLVGAALMYPDSVWYGD